MKYLILWFEVNGIDVGVACNRWDVARGFIEIHDKKGNLLAVRPIGNFKKISGMPFSSVKPEFLRWDERKKFLDRYPA